MYIFLIVASFCGIFKTKLIKFEGSEIFERTQPKKGQLFTYIPGSHIN